MSRGGRFADNHRALRLPGARLEPAAEGQWNAEGLEVVWLNVAVVTIQGAFATQNLRPTGTERYFAAARGDSFINSDSLSCGRASTLWPSTPVMVWAATMALTIASSVASTVA